MESGAGRGRREEGGGRKEEGGLGFIYRFEAWLSITVDESPASAQMCILIPSPIKWRFNRPSFSFPPAISGHVGHVGDVGDVGDVWEVLIQPLCLSRTKRVKEGRIKGGNEWKKWDNDVYDNRWRW